MSGGVRTWSSAAAPAPNLDAIDSFAYPTELFGQVCRDRGLVERAEVTAASPNADRRSPWVIETQN
jgi:hypothetical protein